MTKATLIDMRRHYLGMAAALKKEIDCHQADLKLPPGVAIDWGVIASTVEWCGHPECKSLKECKRKGTSLTK